MIVYYGVIGLFVVCSVYRKLRIRIPLPINNRYGCGTWHDALPIQLVNSATYVTNITAQYSYERDRVRL